MTDEHIERGAAEEMSGAPLTDTEADTATTPASQPRSGDTPARTDEDAEVQQGTADTSAPRPNAGS